MQIDGYSLDAQKSRMKAFCEFNDYEIAGEYEDVGKSGKSTEGRVAFNDMMEDIRENLMSDYPKFDLFFMIIRLRILYVAD
jgi:site-specific DNA recombinase